ncbi:3-hydroxyacyl-CoA dehydrogenase family protein [Fundicoccus culcitae]|uniref:3-hydroxyacyl-CoA dehydrogenase family protein n=1 Tax=Fundicoccus culcitae TaxID=2969821 RepID=A0ABY5P7K0_9LACT|nr:3-hydroxyacyl-CoA dehydrogenase family protein [Fundicoccus culcitae]UUX34707.1 3-hydroxyacyl-CoA dehydrogenase family protein [Fundicoccus culcitae]
MKQIKKVVVIGAGVMGRQIALHCAKFDFKVNLVDEFEESLQTGKDWIKEYFKRSIDNAKMDQASVDQANEKLTYSNSLDSSITDADLVIESVIEDEGIKKDILQRVSKIVNEDTIITTNSSFLASSLFADVVENPSRLANLHFFTPVSRMSLVEIIKGPHTSDETIETLQEFAKNIDKDSVVLQKEIDGFVVNRLLKVLMDEAVYLYDQGYADFKDIDIAAEKGLNHPVGPFRLMDMTGIDISYLNRLHRYEKTNDLKDKPADILKKKYESGEFGRKTGKGWYNYD